MQILESLVYGGSEVTTSDVIIECATLAGYVECMQELVDNDILTESVVMEGIDVKAIGKQALELVKTMINKIKGLITKLIGFFKGRKGKVKAVAMSSASKKETHNKTNGDPSEVKNKSKIDRVFESYPYSGIHPETIGRSNINVLYYAKGFREGIYRLTMNIENYLKYIASSNCADDDIYDIEHSASRINAKFNEGQDVVLSYITRSRENGDDADYDSIAGKIKSIDDCKHIPLMFYKYYSNNERYDNHILTMEEFGHLYGGFYAVSKSYSEFADDISRELADQKEKVDELSKQVGDARNKMESDNFKNPDDISKALRCVQDSCIIAVQAMVSFGAGMTEYCNTMETDLDKVSSYITQLIVPLREAGYNVVHPR